MPVLNQQKGGGIITWDSNDWVSGLDASGQFTSQAVIKQTDKYGWQYCNNIDPFQHYGVLSPGLAPFKYTKNDSTPDTVLTGTVMAVDYYTIYLYGITNTGQIIQAYPKWASNLNPNIISPALHLITGTSPVGQDEIIYTHNYYGSTVQAQSLFYSYYNNTNWGVGVYENFTTFVDGFISNSGQNSLTGSPAPVYPDLTLMPGTLTTNGTTTITGTDTSFTTDMNVGDTLIMYYSTLVYTAIIYTINSDTSLTVNSIAGIPSETMQWTYFPSANVAVPHPLCIGWGVNASQIYIGDGNFLHAYDGSVGTNGTFYSKVFTFPSNIQIVGMVMYNATMLIIANDTLNLQAVAYSWDFNQQNQATTIPLEDNSVSSIFIYRGRPTVITTGIQERNGQNKIKVISGISTTKLADFDGIAPSMRGISVADTVLYMNAGGKIISCGDRFNPKSYAINNISTCDLTGTSGFLWYNVANSASNISLAASGGLSIDNFDHNGTDNATINSSFLQVPFAPQTVGKIKNIQVNYYNGLAVNGGNGAFSLLFGFEYQTPATTVVNALTSVVASSNILTKKYLWDSSNNPFPYFTSLAPKMIWTASTTGVPLVSSIQVEYDDIVLPSN